jgi:hypothetical protein
MSLSPIPLTSINKYTQVFKSNDLTSTGYMSANQAKGLLVQTGLNQITLAQIWFLSDYDDDGQLTLNEFILAMHFCDCAKAGCTLPNTLPVELQPNNLRPAPINNQSPVMPAVDAFGPLGDQAFVQASNKPAVSFEEKRRENFDKGNAVLEAKRKMLLEQIERENNQRAEKERLENEKKNKIKEEHERRRLAELEKQAERQRMLEQQKDEERRKAVEQREAARNESLRQQRIEWELKRKNDLESQKLKLQEQLTTLKAKDKNLEYDIQLLVGTSLTPSKTYKPVSSFQLNHRMTKPCRQKRK